MEEDEAQRKQAEDEVVFLRFGDDCGMHPNAQTVRNLTGDPCGTTIKASAAAYFPCPNIRIAGGKSADRHIGKSAGTRPTNGVVIVVIQSRVHPRAKAIRGRLPKM